MTTPTDAWIEREKRYIEDVMGGMPQCTSCAHKTGAGKCKAFPAGIPLDIISGKHDHQKPYPGDNGILFEPRSGSPSVSPSASISPEA